MKKITILIISAFILFYSINVEAIVYCDGDELKENITVDGTVITVGNDLCNLGCLNETIGNWGGPGCREEPIWLWVAIIIIIIILAVLFWGINR